MSLPHSKFFSNHSLPRMESTTRNRFFWFGKVRDSFSGVIRSVPEWLWFGFEWPNPTDTDVFSRRPVKSSGLDHNCHVDSVSWWWFPKIFSYLIYRITGKEKLTLNCAYRFAKTDVFNLTQKKSILVSLKHQFPPLLSLIFEANSFLPNPYHALWWVSFQTHDLKSIVKPMFSISFTEQI